MTRETVQLGTTKVTFNGGSTYVLIPPTIRESYLPIGTVLSIHLSPDSDDIILKKVKKD